MIDTSSPIFETVEGARVESVLTVSGPVVTRSDETVNEAIPTGRVEVQITEVKVESPADVLPLQVNSDEDSGEDIRLTLSLSGPAPRKDARNILLRSM